LQFHQDVEKRVVHRLRGGNPNQGFPSPPFDRKARTGECRAEVDPGLAKRLARRETRLKRILFSWPKRDNFDFGVQRLTQGGSDRQLAKSGRVRNHRHEQHGRNHENDSGH
jgi:hypothetical protein